MEPGLRADSLTGIPAPQMILIVLVLQTRGSEYAKIAT